MVNALSLARAILGSEEESGFSDKAVKDAIWDQWFDVDAAVRRLRGSLQIISSSLRIRNNMLILQTREIERLQPRSVKVRESYIHFASPFLLARVCVPFEFSPNWASCKGGIER
jgi:hypothetical protein